jgi:hypothetical protein
MKSIMLAIYVCVVVFAFYSCDKCRYLDCISSDYSAQFRIVSKINGNDLVFGNNSIYDKNKIKFFYLKGNDTSFLQYNPISRYLNDTRDSILDISFPENFQPIIFIKLNNVDTDTLAMTYLTENTKCCGVVTTISKLIYNNTNDIIKEGGIRELKK